jgi:hypothetical protein
MFVFPLSISGQNHVASDTLPTGHLLALHPDTTLKGEFMIRFNDSISVFVGVLESYLMKFGVLDSSVSLIENLIHNIEVNKVNTVSWNGKTYYYFLADHSESANSIHGGYALLSSYIVFIDQQTLSIPLLLEVSSVYKSWVSEPELDTATGSFYQKYLGQTEELFNLDYSFKETGVFKITKVSYVYAEMDENSDITEYYDQSTFAVGIEAGSYELKNQLFVRVRE